MRRGNRKIAVLPIVIEMLTTKPEVKKGMYGLPGIFSLAIIPIGLSTSLKKYHPLFFFDHLKTVMA